MTTCDERCNIFHALAPAEYNEARELIISLVLVTDIKAWHLKLTGKIKAMIAGGRQVEVRNGGDEGLAFVLKTVIKLCDIGHTAKELEVHYNWTANIVEEFFCQGDDERMRGMQISPFMERSTENTFKNQSGFLNYVVSRNAICGGLATGASVSQPHTPPRTLHSFVCSFMFLFFGHIFFCLRPHSRRPCLSSRSAATAFQSSSSSTGSAKRITSTGARWATST